MQAEAADAEASCCNYGEADQAQDDEDMPSWLAPDPALRNMTYGQMAAREQQPRRQRPTAEEVLGRPLLRQPGQPVLRLSLGNSQADQHADVGGGIQADAHEGEDMVSDSYLTA